MNTFAVTFVLAIAGIFLVSIGISGIVKAIKKLKK